jgi:nitrate reductase NapAB chaperone NapD
MIEVFVFSKESAGGLGTFINSLSKLKNVINIKFYFYKKDAYSPLNHLT